MYSAKYPEPGRYEYEKLIKYYTKKLEKYRKINRVLNSKRNYDRYKRYASIKTMEKSYDHEKIKTILTDGYIWESQKIKINTINALEDAINNIEEYKESGKNSSTERIKNDLLKKVALEYVSNLDIWEHVEANLLVKDIDAVKNHDDVMAMDNLRDIDERTGERISFSDTVLKRSIEKAKIKSKNSQRSVKEPIYGHLSFEKSTKTLLTVIRDYKMLTWDETIFYIIEIIIEAERFNASINFSRRVYGNHESNRPSPAYDWIVDQVIKNTDIDDIDSFFKNYCFLKVSLKKE
jgi:hypothetical protein